MTRGSKKQTAAAARQEPIRAPPVKNSRKRRLSLDDSQPSQKVARPRKAQASTGSSRRHPPAEIVNSDEELESSDAVSKPVKPSRKRPVEYNEDEGSDQHAHQSDEDDMDNVNEANEDLQQLNDREVAKTLQGEYVNWTSKKPKPHPSDFNKGDGMSDSDDNTGHIDKKTTTSKRGEARKAEVPQWRGKGSTAGALKLRGPKQMVAAGGVPDESPDDSDAGAAVDVDSDAESPASGDNAQWQHAPYHARVGRGLLPILQQPLALQFILRKAIRTAIGDAMFESAYVTVEGQQPYFVGILVNCARSLKQEPYVARLENDVVFQSECIRILQGRLSQHRSKVKEHAVKFVEGHYGLAGDGSPEDDAKITDLLKGWAFIYPEEKGSLVTTRPYHHLAIKKIIRKVYFTSRRGQTLAQKHVARFGSVYAQGDKSTQLELPAALVALVGTCVHAILNDNATGQQNHDFNADHYADTYKLHMDFIKDLRAKKITGYHKIVHDLYVDATKYSKQPMAANNNPMMLLNLDGLESGTDHD